MRVYVPDKRDSLLGEVLQELYVLRQAIDHQSGTVNARIKIVDDVREKLKKMFQEDI